jgi:CRISPR-associated protein Cmr4
MKTHVFLITAKTNLHVGNESGGEFTIIDKAIQRDPLTNLPCINSSSLKGAINEFCCNTDMKSAVRKDLFGSDKKEKGDSQKGGAIFFDAKLLFMPQQDDQTLFHYATSDSVIEMLKQRIHLFCPSFTYQTPSTLNGKKVNVEKDQDFKDMCDNNNLPIIARNTLENGESKNLWYEQVLPAETVLYTVIQEEGEELKKALDGKIVQIGANATIGYGYCKFECINKED